MSDDKGVGLKGWLAGQKSKSTRNQGKTEAISLDRNRVAVLPLTNFSVDPNDEYFSDGMTEELISALANVSGLQVISRTSVMQYKKTSKIIGEIGRELAAGSVIEGSVRRSGNQVRISVQLIDTREDKHLWAQTYDRELKDVFAVQRDIATNVSDALRVKLLPKESAQLQTHPTSNVEAYTLYLKGRHQWNKRSEESIKRAIDYFQLAIKQDPNYALAYTGLADSYSVLADWGFVTLNPAYAKAREAAVKAIELQDNLAEAHASLGFVLINDWNWVAAEAEFRRALELNPNYASSRQWYSILLSVLGRADEALFQIRKAVEIDPLSPIIATHVGARLLEMGEYELSIVEFRKALEIQEDFPLALVSLAVAQAARSNGEGFAECERRGFLQDKDPYLRVQLAYACALLGRRDQALKILEENVRNINSDSLFLTYAAKVHSALGDNNKAMELLWSGYESHNPSLWKINIFGSGNLPSDTKFIELEKKIGLRK